MFRSSHYSWFDHPNNIWWEVQFIKLRHVVVLPWFEALIGLLMNTQVFPDKSPCQLLYGYRLAASTLTLCHRNFLLNFSTPCI
jgi:hypothetical protein